MRPNGKHLNRFREVHPLFGKSPNNSLQCFFFVMRSAGVLRIISSGPATATEGLHAWEHVSVSLVNRCPTWEEMCQVKQMFWRDDEAVVQFHPPKLNYVNDHAFTLHLWKKAGANVELPPVECV